LKNNNIMKWTAILVNENMSKDLILYKKII